MEMGSVMWRRRLQSDEWRVGNVFPSLGRHGRVVRNDGAAC